MTVSRNFELTAMKVALVQRMSQSHRMPKTSGRAWTTSLAVGSAPPVMGAETITWATDNPEFTGVVAEDLNNYPVDGNEIKSARLRQAMPSDLPDGAYRVVISNVRDKAGNVGIEGYGEEGIFNDWIIRLGDGEYEVLSPKAFDDKYEPFAENPAGYGQAYLSKADPALELNQGVKDPKKDEPK